MLNYKTWSNLTLHNLTTYKNFLCFVSDSDVDLVHLLKFRDAPLGIKQVYLN